MPIRYRFAARLGCSPSTRLLQAALQKPVAGGQQTNIVKNVSVAASTAERCRTISPMTPATGVASSTTTSN
eukprot:1387859-Prymnesium_polylepis.1